MTARTFHDRREHRDTSADVPVLDGTAPEFFPIIGLGASAGGLDALEQLFAGIPAESGMAFVVAIHQNGSRRTVMPDLLRRKTPIPIVEVIEGVDVERDHIYLAPPGRYVALREGVLEPRDPDDVGLPMPIDFFFRSLAQSEAEHAIGILLSGTGTDGAVGIREIKAQGGTIFVQAEPSAPQPGMPHSAIATELADQLLAPAAMAPRLLAHVHAPGRPPRLASARPEDEVSRAEMEEVFAELRTHVREDFSQYKGSTMRRRIERRMSVHNITSMMDYAQYLHHTPSEVEILFQELLIGVTSFFRDPEAFDALGEALAALVADKPDDQVLRAWVPGCSTGEEAYSIAILLREQMERGRRHCGVQIFATDLDAEALEIARVGAYDVGIARDVSPERLERYFVRQDGQGGHDGHDGGMRYQVKKDVREMVIFAGQSIVEDPPFTKLDLLSARNLLIYLDAKLQQRLLPTFGYALKPNGLLLLGPSENIGGFADMFDVVSKKWKLFRRRGTPFARSPQPSAQAAEPRTSAPIRAATRPAPEATANALAERALLRELIAPTVLVNERGDITHIHGRTGMFLEPAPGLQTTNNVFHMARAGLKADLATAMREAAAEGNPVVRRGVRLTTEGTPRLVNLRVRRLPEPEGLRGLFLITFEDAGPLDDTADALEGGKQTLVLSTTVGELERRLRYTRESHQQTIAELEATNEKLKSANQELQSANEALQFSIEELEASKEEMQALNQELHSVNAELQGKVEELSRANDDMTNLLNGTDIATVFLDDGLNIKRYTEQTKRVIRIIPSDVGRPIGDLVARLSYSGLVTDAREVLRTLVAKEVEVQGDGLSWYLMRILPYRTTENRIHGLVVTFVDITHLKALQVNEARLIQALEGSPTTVFGQDRNGRFNWVCGPAFGRPPGEVLGAAEADILGRDGAAVLGALRRQALETGKVVRRSLSVSVRGTPRVIDFYVEPLRNAAGELTSTSTVAAELPSTPERT